MESPSPPSCPSSPYARSSVRYQTVPQHISSAEMHNAPRVEQSLWVSDEQRRDEPLTRLSNEPSANDRGSAMHPSNANISDNTPRFTKQGIKLSTIITDCSTVVTSLLFLGFGIAVFLLNGLEVDQLIYGRWQNAIVILATLFPILFASTVGRLVYETARWKLEQGSTLGTLEQLIGSRTVGATLLTQIKLRLFNLLGALLLVIWAFSPLGAQSILRMLASHLQPVTEHSSIVYFNTDARSQAIYPFIDHGGDLDDMVLRNALVDNWYKTLLLTPEAQKVETMDLWGNVKIPFLSQERKPDIEGWTEVAPTSDPVFYSSLAGLAVMNVSAGNTTFSLESSYLSLTCSKVQGNSSGYGPRINFTTHDWDDTDGKKLLNDTITPTTRKNGSWHGFNFNRTTQQTTWSIALDRFVDNFWCYKLTKRPEIGDRNSTPALFKQEVGVEVKPTKLLFQSHFVWGSEMPVEYAKAYCHTRQEYVESRILCSRATASASQNCTVTAQRPSQKPHAPNPILHFSFPEVFRQGSWQMPLATYNLLPSHKPDLSLQYLLNPKFDIVISTSQASLGHFESISNFDFSRRLAQLLNTYFLLSQEFLAIQNGSFYDNYAYFDSNISTPVEARHLTETYIISMPWTVLFFLSCLVLLLCAVLSIVFTHIADGPEILGYASTAIRDSKFVKISDRSGAQVNSGEMDATAITLLMKKERVRYGYIHPNLEGNPLLGVGREGETQPIRTISSVLKSEAIN